MMRSPLTPAHSVARRRALAVSVASLAVGTAGVIPLTPAVAVGTDCGTATAIADGLCEVVFTSTPAQAWTPPTGTETLQALLVGSGGQGSDPYGGGGGEVRLVELNPEGAVTIQVGAPTTGASTEAANASSVSQLSTVEMAQPGAQGGSEGYVGGSSGNGNAGMGYSHGGGAGGAATERAPGAGVVVGDLALSSGNASLFAGDTRCLAGGGMGGAWSPEEDFTTPACGGGYVDIPTLTGFVPVAGSGGGGAGVRVLNQADSFAQGGAGGSVTLRFTVAGGGDELAVTGADSLPIVLAGIAALGLGALFVGSSRRRRITSRQ